METHARWFSVVSFVLWLRYTSTGAVTTLTNLTFVPQTLTWNDARDACHHMDGHLVEIHDETKQNVVLHWLERLLTSLNTTDSGRQKSISIGLANLTSKSTELYWAESCSPVTWQRWKPTTLNLDMKCVKLPSSKRWWAPSYCFRERHYMCESPSGEKCPYTRYPYRRLQPGLPLNSTDSPGPDLKECMRLCDNTVSDLGVECWAFNHNSNRAHCELFFTTQPYLLASSVSDDTGKLFNLYIRECYNAVVGDFYNLTREPNASPEPQVNCTTASSTTSRTTSPSITITTTVQATLLTSQTSDTEDSLAMGSVTSALTTPPAHITPLSSWSNDSYRLTSIETMTTAREASKSGMSNMMTSTSTVRTTTPEFNIPTTSEQGFSRISKAVESEMMTSATTKTTTAANHSYTTPEKVSSRTSQALRSEVSQLMTSAETKLTEPNHGLTTPEHVPSRTSRADGTEVSKLMTSSTRTSTTAVPYLSLTTSNQAPPVTSEMSSSTTAFRRPDVKPPETSTTDELHQKRNESCSCACYKMASLHDKTNFLEDLMRNLTINITQMSSFRRKYYSVMDDRPLAVGIGSSGIVCLVLILLLVVFCDVTKFKIEQNNKKCRKLHSLH